MNFRQFSVALTGAIGFIGNVIAADLNAMPPPVASAKPPSAAQPSTKVAAVNYRSVFKETPMAAREPATSKDWPAANRDVGHFLRGHVDILKWEEQQEKTKTHKPQSAP